MTRARALPLMLSLACTPTPSSHPPLDAQLTAAREFQRAYEAELRADDRSFLTAIAAHYLEPGETLELEVGGVAIVAVADAEGLDLRIAQTSQRIDAEGGQVELGDARHLLAVSRQDHDFRVLVHDREAAARREFEGLAWFPVDAAWIVPARFEPLAPRETRDLQTSRGVTKPLYLAGVFEFELAGRAERLEAFAYAAEPTPGEPLLIPFRDATTGTTSYAAGRYLEPALGDAWLDFNRATNPLCAYSEHYNCPMPPRFNRLDVAIEAGARSPAEH